MAIDLVKKVHHEDRKKNYQHALRSYQDAVGYFLPANVRIYHSDSTQQYDVSVYENFLESEN